MQIKTKLPIYYSIIGIIVTIWLMYVFSWWEKLIVKNIENNFSQKIESKSREIDKFLYEQLSAMRNLASDNNIIDSLSNIENKASLDQNLIKNAVEDFLSINKSFYYTEIIDKQWIVIEWWEIIEKENLDKVFLIRDSISKRLWKSDFNEVYFKKILNEINKNPNKWYYEIQDVIKDVDFNTYITYIVPIFKNTENWELVFLWLIKAKLSTDSITNLIADVNIWTTWDLYIYNKDNVIISSLSGRDIFTKFTNNRASIDKYINWIYVQNEDIDWINKLAAYKFLEWYKTFSWLNWVIKATQNHSELFSAMESLKTWVYLTILFIIFSVLFLATVIQWQFINPLWRVLKKVREFASGDENVKIEVESKDEIWVLAWAFNDMIYKIREKTKILNEYKNVIDATSLVSKVDQSWNFIYVNDIFCDSAWCELKEIIWKPHQMIRHPDIGDEIFKDIEKTMKAKEIWKWVMKNRRKDWSEYWLQSVIAPILDMKNNIVEMILIETDITELEKTKQQLQVSYDKLQESTDALVTKERISKEFELATKIQEDFMPRPGDFEIEWVEVHCGLTSATEIWWDLYDIVKCKDDSSKTIFYIWDVTWHGLISWIMMAICNSLLYNLAQNCANSISDILIKLNNTLFHKLPSKVFITLLLLQYDSNAWKITYAWAGHERLLVYRKEKDEIEEIKTWWSAIWMFADITNDVKVNELNLSSWDVVLMYTDWIPEARNNSNEFYWLDRFKDSFKSNAHRNTESMYESILKDLYDFIWWAEILDDITLFLIKRK